MNHHSGMLKSMKMKAILSFIGIMGRAEYTPAFFVYGNGQNKWIEIKKVSELGLQESKERRIYRPTFTHLWVNQFSRQDGV
jgi:hypothetical protein